MDTERRLTADGPLTEEHLKGYRAAVDELVQQIAGGPADPSRAASAVAELAADRPEVRAVLDRLPGGGQGTLARLEQEVLTFRPSARSNALTPATLAKILLLHQVDVMWWSSVAPFPDDSAVARSPQLTSLLPLHRKRLLAFHFRVGATRLPNRARRYALRRWAPGREPQSSGLSYPVARPAIIGLLNEVAARFAESAPGWKRGLWVNCIVRSVAVQQRLRQLGYSAFLPSAHCAGYAADIEMAWLHRHDMARPLQEVLTAYRNAGVLNVIDEGQAWHICLNPAVMSTYEDMARPLTAAAMEVDG